MFVALAAALLFQGCLTLAPRADTDPATARILPELTAAQIADRLPEFPTALRELYAETDVAVASPEENGRFAARISYRRADSTLIRVRFPLGVEGARVLITSDSAFVYDRIEGVLIAGTPEAISAALPVAVAATDLIDTAFGFVAPASTAGWSATSDSIRYRLTSPDGRTELTVDPDIWRVVNVTLRDAAGMILEQRWYTNFSQFNETLLPQRMSLSRPPEDTRLTMALRALRTDPAGLSFDLNVSPGVERRIIR